MYVYLSFFNRVHLVLCVLLLHRIVHVLSDWHFLALHLLIPSPLQNITVATFADLWGYKWEAYQASVWGPQILSDAGVKTCLKVIFVLLL